MFKTLIPFAGVKHSTYLSFILKIQKSRDVGILAIEKYDTFGAIHRHMKAENTKITFRNFNF